MSYQYYKILSLFPPELAHRIVISALKLGLNYKKDILTYKRLKSGISSLQFSNPLGLSAGFDKNGESLNGLSQLGFSHIEIGTVTPYRQKGNKKPRVFRIQKAKSIINRLGFPNEGMEKVLERIKKYRISKYYNNTIIGINISCNKEETDPITAYTKSISFLGDQADYFTINVSSPNTVNLRKLQNSEKLDPLLEKINYARKKIEDQRSKRLPIILKISPDLEPKNIPNVVKICRNHNVDAIASSNTTTSRPKNINHSYLHETGGLSGRLLFSLSTIQLAKFYLITQGNPSLIGIGGIDSSDTAWKKIRAGANIIQIYTGLVYNGPNLINTILTGLENKLKDNNYKNISEIIGIDANKAAKGDFE